tara:strand:+ start:854 stop:1726 length:873 start_codon:yes stop_codon:yes gene_type:complete
MTKRNNEKRAGTKKTVSAAPVPPILHESSPESKPTFSFATPTQFVELPSKGKYYPEDHCLHNVENVEIKFMTAKDEDVLASRTLLQKGLAIDRFLQNIIVDKSIDVDSLLIGDKNAIMVAARITGYGPLYETKVTCPACAGVSDYEFNLEFCPINYGADLGELGIEHLFDNVFSIQLPVTKVNVSIRLINGYDEKRISSKADKKRRNKLPDISNITDLCKALIVSVEGQTGRKEISEFVDSMPAYDSKHIRTSYDAIMPDLDMKHDFLCRHCGTDTTLEVPLNAEFFWPK